MQASNTPEAEENDGHGAVTASVSKKKKKMRSRRPRDCGEIFLLVVVMVEGCSLLPLSFPMRGDAEAWRRPRRQTGAVIGTTVHAAAIRQAWSKCSISRRSRAGSG